MPYTKPESRKRFITLIEDVVTLIGKSGKSPYIQGEYFGFFANRLIKRYLKTPDIESESATSFNARSFNESVKKALATASDKACAMIDGLDPIKAAGDLNYVISSTFWGIMGDSEGVELAGYGIRSYFRGIIEKIRDTVVPLHGNGSGDSVMNFRRHLIVRGVLGDVVSEFYDRKNRSYEDGKMIENGDIWENGRLIVKE